MHIAQCTPCWAVALWNLSWVQAFVLPLWRRSYISQLIVMPRYTHQSQTQPIFGKHTEQSPDRSACLLFTTRNSMNIWTFCDILVITSTSFIFFCILIQSWVISYSDIVKSQFFRIEKARFYEFKAIRDQEEAEKAEARARGEEKEDRPVSAINPLRQVLLLLWIGFFLWKSWVNDYVHFPA